MFLIVFVTLAVSILGLFAQVLSLQTTRAYHEQTALAQTMMVWHRTAVQLAQGANTAPDNATDMIGCRLTNPSASTTIPLCTHSGASVAVTSSYLPPGYNTSYYRFSSLVYQTTATPTSRYVVTYTPYADSNGFLHLPDSSGPAIAQTFSDLKAQFSRLHRPGLTYGIVTASGTLTAPADLAMTKINVTTPSAMPTITFAVPTSIPTGSVAVLSSAL